MGRKDHPSGGRRRQQGGGGGSHSPVVKLPKDYIHVGICLFYTGLAFRGLQLQTHGPTHETVEGVLLQALKDVGLVTMEGGKPVMNVNLSRSCRTDRGVHAVRNLVSLYVPPPARCASSSSSASASGPTSETAEKAEKQDCPTTPSPTPTVAAAAAVVDNEEEDVPTFSSAFTHEEEEAWLNSLAERINQHLPRVVRVAKVMRLTANFVPRHCCNRRVYRYLIPLYAMLDPLDSWEACLRYFPCMSTDLTTLRKQATQDRAMSQLFCWNFTQTGTNGSVDMATGGCLPFNMGDSGRKEEEEEEQGVESKTDTSSSSSSLAAAWLPRLMERVQTCNRLLQSHVVGSHRFHNFCVDAEVRGKVQHMKMIPSWSDEALRSVQRCEVLPRLYFLPSQSRGPTCEDCCAYTDMDDNSGRQSSTNEPSISGGIESALPFLPFLVFQIEGSSFLFNMIRKIVGTMLATCRSTRETVWDDLLSPTRRGAAPLAPGPYLYLALSSYHGYDRTVIGGKFTRFQTIRQAWKGQVCESAESFAWREITQDILDVDLHRVPPLEDVLERRARYLEKHRPTLAEEDAHLLHKKSSNAPRNDSGTHHTTPKVSEMTMFLRSLKMHNWMWSTPTLPPGCMVGVESNRMAKRRRRQEEEEERLRQEEQKKRKMEDHGDGVSGVATEDRTNEPANTCAPLESNTSEPADVPSPTDPASGDHSASISNLNQWSESNEAENDDEACQDSDEEDGWIYLGESAEAVRQLRQERRSRNLLKRSSRPWEP